MQEAQPPSVACFLVLLSHYDPSCKNEDMDPRSLKLWPLCTLPQCLFPSVGTLSRVGLAELVDTSMPAQG